MVNKKSLQTRYYGPRTKFDIPNHAQQHIVALDVSVDDPVLMEVFEACKWYDGVRIDTAVTERICRKVDSTIHTLCRLTGHGSDLTFCHEVGGDDVCQGACDGTNKSERVTSQERMTKSKGVDMRDDKEGWEVTK